MLERMFVADADGVSDRLLDVTTAVSGAHFFAAAQDVLDAPADDFAPADPDLGIGSLRHRS